MTSYVKVPADGITQIFPVPSRYLSRDHIRVMRNGVTMMEPGDYEWLNDTQVRFRAIPPEGALIECRRVTPDATSLVTFTNGAVLTAEDLNTAALQSLLRAEELQDQIDGYLTSSLIRYALGGSAGALLPEEMIAAVAQDVLNSALLADLQENIGNIAENAESIINQTLRLDDLQATVDSLSDIDGTGIATFIVNEQEARIEGDNAINATLDLIGAKSGDNTSFILNTGTVKVSPTESLGTRLSALLAADAANSAAIVSEQTARVSGDNANASSISSLQTTVNGHTSSISTIQNVVSGPGGLTAQYMVKTDVNGRVAGFGLYNDGVNSDFIVLATKFAIVEPGTGKTPKVPFVVTGGVVYMQNVVIQDALIQNLTITKLTNGTLNGDMSIGTGRIIYNNGSTMLVTGVGFGTSNQFIEWFGPTQSNVNLCSESNAKAYKKTNGDIYTSGSITTGTLLNEATTSSLSSTAQLTVGPFGTNGNPISVKCSYNGTYTAFQTGNTTGDTANTGTLQLYRTIGAGTETLVATISLTGNCHHADYDPEFNRTRINSTLSGSTTYTDNAGGTGNRTYRAVLTARNMHHGPENQLISIIATEG